MCRRKSRTCPIPTLRISMVVCPTASIWSVTRLAGTRSKLQGQRAAGSHLSQRGNPVFLWAGCGTLPGPGLIGTQTVITAREPFYRLGGDFSFNYHAFNLIGQYLYGHDQNQLPFIPSGQPLPISFSMGRQLLSAVAFWKRITWPIRG